MTNNEAPTAATQGDTKADGTFRVQGISKSFLLKDSKTGEPVKRQVLKEITFDIPRDKFVVLFGPNASGKTTLLKIIAGLEAPDSGIIEKPRPDMRIDLIFQNYRDSLFPWKDVLQNIAFPLELSGVSKKERNDAARSLLAEIGSDVLSENDYKKYPYELSGGQQQLIAFSRALIVRPDLLLLDESFAALDHDTRYLMQDVLIKAWEELKFRVLFISHSVWEAVYMADVVVLLSKRPANVLDVVEVPLERPRKREVEYSKDFFELRSEILRVFESELYGRGPIIS